MQFRFIIGFLYSEQGVLDGIELVTEAQGSSRYTRIAKHNECLVRIFDPVQNLDEFIMKRVQVVDFMEPFTCVRVP